MLFRSNDTATTEIYTPTNTLSLHDALLISAHSCLVDSVFEVGDALFVAFSDAPKITKATMTAIANRHLPERRGGRCSWVGGVVVTP